MNERLEPRVYLDELRELQASISAATSRSQALGEEEQPLAVADGLDLDGLVLVLERAEERALQAVTAAEILLAAEGLSLE
ncbi:MAG: hypothetical protein H0T57_04895 [Rubrobacter sp.]|nr:hypothetical protein [Rubrobacter sp.]